MKQIRQAKSDFASGKMSDNYLEFFNVMKVIFVEITQFRVHASQKKTNYVVSGRSKILQIL